MKDFTTFDIIIAVCASFLLPGLGQLFELKFAMALAFMFAVMVGYIAFPPVGILLHITNIVDASFAGYENS